eukprot:1328744-Rhodomonas_salina.2
MAGLMRAILSSMIQDHSVQNGLRLLLQILLEQPRIYVIGVFYEMSVNGSQRLLAGLLMRLLDASQSCFRERWDFSATIGTLLAMPMPRRADYMAGGKYQRRSYYEAVYQIAANIIDDSDDYLGLKFWLTANVQTNNLLPPDPARLRSVPAGPQPPARTQTAVSRTIDSQDDGSVPFHSQLRSDPFQELVQAALRSVLAADDAGQRLYLAEAKMDLTRDAAIIQGLRSAAVGVYRSSFSACRALVAHDHRSLLRIPWLKAYYERNLEALVVRTITRNILQDVDRVRGWLVAQPCSAAAGLTQPELERLLAECAANPTQAEGSFYVSDALLAHVVEAIYFHAPDRRRLLADPLVRLCVVDEASEASALDFTIVSGMGVITEGCAGQELQASLGRLQALHGVAFVRANTGTARHLEVTCSPRRLRLASWACAAAPAVCVVCALSAVCLRAAVCCRAALLLCLLTSACAEQYNAARIEEAVREVTTSHWGWLGYSQGCANQWRAESLLASGTPDQQTLLAGLATRNLLYSAANGTPHSTCAEWKISETIVDMEMELKRYRPVPMWCARTFRGTDLAA